MKSLHKPLRRLLSSSAGHPPAVNGSLNLSADRRFGPVDDTPVYLRPMLRRPPTVKRCNVRGNSCSFIGRVVRPVTRFSTEGSWPASYTILEVKSRPRDPGSSPFRIMLSMCNDFLEMSLKHLKPNDYIYVSGPISSYEKVYDSGQREVFYKVHVMDLNFVRCKDPNQISPIPASSGAEVSTLLDGNVAGLVKFCRYALSMFDSSAGTRGSEDRSRDRLRLWQVFFANPYEWWDNRGRKKYPRQPDFKHKDTKECLWLKPDDPPWVRKQLQLCDSNTAGHRRDHRIAFERKLGDFDLFDV